MKVEGTTMQMGCWGSWEAREFNLGGSYECLEETWRYGWRRSSAEGKGVIITLTPSEIQENQLCNG